MQEISFNEVTEPISKVSALALLAALALAACEAKTTKDQHLQDHWPANLTTPIEGATFSLTESHLPGALREYRAGTHQGFDFFNGLSSRPLAEDEPIVAIADGEVVRIDHDYTEPDPDALAFWTEQAELPGFTGDYALDLLRGRQVWLRHADGHISRYAHLSRVHPELGLGDSVSLGQPIGLMGNSAVVATEDQSEPAPHLHFEFWSPDGQQYLGEGLAPLDIHRQVAEIFGEQALPRYARQAVAAVNAGDPPPDPYPPAELPETGFSAEPPARAMRGHPFAVPITWEGEDFTSGDFFGYLEGHPLGVVDAGDGAWLLAAMPLEVENHELNLVIGGTDLFGQTLLGGRAIEAVQRERTPTPMEIDPEIFARYSDENSEIEAQRLGPVMMESLQIREALWDDSFNAPIDGDIIRQFGQPIFHGILRPAHPLPGITVTAESGRPVLAANSGRVAYTGELPIRGRTVAIIHGGGVVSLYAHLDEIGVSRGDAVQRGQRLGSVGQSGAVDQPQLRWEMHIGGIATDPVTWPGQMVPGRPQG